jgi:hypothetical protein
MTRVVLLFLIPAATLTAMFLRSYLGVRRKRTELLMFIRHFSHDWREVPEQAARTIKNLMTCDFVEVLDGKEQRFISFETTQAFKLFLTKETKRDRYWAKLQDSHEVFESRCRGSSRLGKAIADLYSAIDRVAVAVPAAAPPPEAAPVPETAGAA